MAGNSREPGRTVTSKLAAILVAFADGGDYSLSELALRTGLAVSTVHRLLKDLARTSLFEHSAGGAYRPGPGLRDLCAAVDPPTLRARAPFVVEDLSSALRATARLGVVDGLEVAYVEKGAGPGPVSLFPNAARLPLHSTAMGTVLLAFGPRSLVRLATAGGPPRPAAAPSSATVTAASLDRALHRTRQAGFALADRDRGRTAVAVPVFDPSGHAVAALEAEVTCSDSRAVDRVAPALSTAARCLRRELAVHRRERPDGSGGVVITPPSRRWMVNDAAERGRRGEEVAL